MALIMAASPDANASDVERIGGRPVFLEEGSDSREMNAHIAPRIKIEIISVIRRFEIKGDMSVLDFMLSIVEL
jgi:hypothetical protein